MIEKERIKKFNNLQENTNGKYILYWMYQNQREELNHSLEFAIYLSNYYKKPLIVYFPVTDY